MLVDAKVADQEPSWWLEEAFRGHWPRRPRRPRRPAEHRRRSAGAAHRPALEPGEPL